MIYDVDEYLNQCKYEKEMKYLRKIILSNPDLEEESKWGKPCYTYGGKNVFLFHEFKDYFAILFEKGILMKDPEKRLIQQTENVHAPRHMRFTSMEELKNEEDTIKKYIAEAVDIEKKKISIPRDEKFDEVFPEELKEKIDSDSKFKEAFENLTPGRQKGYMLYFSGAKKSETRTNRIEKNHERILEGLGIYD